MVGLYFPRSVLVMDPYAGMLRTLISCLHTAQYCISIDSDQSFKPAHCRLGRVLQPILSNRCSNVVLVLLDDYLYQTESETQGSHRNCPMPINQWDKDSIQEKQFLSPSDIDYVHDTKRIEILSYGSPDGLDEVGSQHRQSEGNENENGQFSGRNGR